MCTKAEVKEVVEDSLRGIVVTQDAILSSITEIKSSLSGLPCNLHNEKILELRFKYKEVIKEIENVKKPLEAIFTRIRTLEEGSNIKIKYVISILLSGMISAGFAILIWKLTRG